MANSTIILALKLTLPNTNLLHKAHHHILTLKDTRRHIFIMFEGNVKQENHQQKSTQKCGTNNNIGRTFVYSLKAKIKQ